MARPTDYTPEIADAIIELMAQGYSVNEICSAEAMPDQTTFYRWLIRHDEFRQKYRDGRDVQTDALMDKQVMLGNMAVRGESDPGALRTASHCFEVAAKRMAPRKYGDKLETKAENTNLTVTADLTTVPDDKLEAAHKLLFGKKESSGE